MKLIKQHNQITHTSNKIILSSVKKNSRKVLVYFLDCMYLNLLNVLGEDTHSGWTTKGIGRVNPPPPDH